MIVEKLMMPYLLSSHHSMVHATLLISQIFIIIFIDPDNPCQSLADSLEKSKCEGVNNAYYAMMIVHAISLIFDFTIVWAQIGQPQTLHSD